MSTRALFVGDVTADLTCVIDHVPGPDEKVHMRTSIEEVGGVIANAALACQRTGTPTALACLVGNDTLGSATASRLRQRLSDVLLTVVEGRTTRVVILLENHGEKRLLLDPGQAFYPDEPTLAGIELADYGWVHTAVYGDSAFTLIQRCRQQGIPWSLDLEPATFANGFASLSNAIDGASLVFCNDRAAALLGENAVARLCDAGAQGIVRTRGADGIDYHGPEGRFRAALNSGIAVRDTTGAGDCLAGWLIGERLAGTPLNDQLRLAVAAASHACQRYGAQASYPERNDIQATDARVSAL